MSIPEYNPRLFGRPCPKCGLLQGFTLEYVYRPENWTATTRSMDVWQAAYERSRNRAMPDTTWNEWLLFTCRSCGYGREMQVENLD